ncbi:MAG: hypothetical protein NWQ05_01030 [Burkholderiaceae bacterium]|nr:hypothetical protein [Burkholderiaceae bacterium]
MDIVLLGLSPHCLQQLAAGLGPALKQLAPNWTLHTPHHPPQSDSAWTPPSLSSRIFLCVNPEDAAKAQAWRAILLAQGLPFQVIHGTAEALVAQCLLAILPPDGVSSSGLAMTTQAASALQGFARQALPVRWQGVCETCSDPDCEQRLFSGLLQGR